MDVCSQTPVRAGTKRLVSTLVGVIVCFATAYAQPAFHSAAITRVAVDPANRVLATASEDKTVRIWELKTGRLLRIIRTASRPGEHGKIYALAISPDGKYIAFAGYTGQKNKRIVEEATYFDYEIYIHDLNSGKRLHTVDVPGIIDNLAWSASGELLLATASEMPLLTIEAIEKASESLHIFKAADYTPADKPQFEYYAAVAAYDPKGRLILIGRPGGSFDAEIFDEDFKLLESRSYPGNPAAISVSPDGSLFAVSTLFSQLFVHTVTDLSAVYKQDLRTERRDSAEYSAVAWSTDGRFLYFAGRGTCDAEGCAIRKWETGNWASYKEIRVSPHRVTSLAPLKSGGIAFGTAGPSFGVVDAQDRRTLYLERRAAVTRSPPGAKPQRQQTARGEHWTECHVALTSPMTTGKFEYVRGKRLYIDKNGASVMVPPFDDVRRFSGGLAQVGFEKKFGYIDRGGRLAIPLQFEIPGGDFSEGRAWVHSDDGLGYIDPTGKLVIPPKYEAAGNFSGGLAWVRERGSSYFGYINAGGETVVPPKFSSADDFHEGLAAVRLGERWGYINTKGEWIIPPKFDLARRFSEGLASVRLEPCRQRGCTDAFIDKTGAIVIGSVRVLYRSEWFSEGMAIFGEEPSLYGFLDRTGRTLIGAAYRHALPFSEGLAAVSPDGEKWGYVNRQGGVVVRPQYDEAMPFSEGRGLVLKGRMWGYVDEAGNETIPARFHEAGEFSEGLAPVCVSAELLSFIPVSRNSPEVSAGPKPVPELEMPKPQPTRLSDADRQRLDELHRRIEALIGQQQYSRALPFAEEALEIAERELPRDHAALIQPLWDLGNIHRVLGDYRAIASGQIGEGRSAWNDARAHLERALNLISRHRGPNSIDSAALAADLSHVHASLSQFDLALDFKQQEIAIRKATAGATSTSAVKATNDLEILRVEKLVNRKQMSKALPLAFAQVQNAETALGANHVNVARGLVNIASIYGASEVGVRSAAIRSHERALRIFAAASGEDGYNAMKARAAIARLYATAHQNVPAERMFDAATRTAERVLAPDDGALVQLLLERGYALRDSGEYEKAASYFTRAVSHYEKRMDERSAVLRLRASLEALANTFRLMGDYSRAEALYRRILERFSMDWAIAARVTNSLGTVQRLSGDLAAAKKSYESVLDLLKQHLSPPSARSLSMADVSTKQALQELAALGISAKDVEAAKDYLLRAAPLDARIFSWFPGSHREALDRSAQESRTNYYHQVLVATARYFREDPEWVSRAFELVLDRKAIALEMQSLTKGTGRPTERARRELEELATVRSELASLMVKRPESMDDEQYARRVTLLFERGLALDQPVAPAWIRREPLVRVKRSDVSAGLPAGTALIEYVRVNDEDPAALTTGERAIYVALVLTAEGRLSLVELGAAREIEVRAGDLQASIRGKSNPALTRELLKELHLAVWTPLEPLLGNARQIIVSPDGELHRVPFAALVNGQHQFLAEHFQFTYVTSGRELARSSRPPSAPGLDLLLVANPNFGAGDTYAPLPGTAKEAQLILPLVAGDRRTALLGSDATEAALKQAPAPRVLHIATHGFFLDDTFGLESEGYEHSLVRSGLALAGANGSGGASGSDDGLLTALEVSGMDLGATELVVLSSCDSGSGSVTYGQGVLGLRHAFALAGAKSLLMTLWPVDDEITAQLMVSFYRNLARLSPAEALHQAQMEAVRRIQERDGDANPSLWAPFVLQSGSGFSRLGR
jgi:CHAT domain-containing protein/tetratricopeptide (TPR) repeat protein